MTIHAPPLERRMSEHSWKPELYRHTLPQSAADLTTKPWLRPVQQHLILKDVNLVDVERSTVVSSMAVELQDGKIKSIFKMNEVKDSGDALIVACDGLYLCPGLIDCHGHVFAPPFATSKIDRDDEYSAAFHLRCLLAQGFTTMRDMGGGTIKQKRATEEWLIPGPRLLVGGKLLCQTGGHLDESNFNQQVVHPSQPHPWAILVDGVDACLKATRRLMAAGADHVKIATSSGPFQEYMENSTACFTEAEVKAVVETVDLMGGTMVASHAISDRGARIAIEAGVKSIEHGGALSEDTLRVMAEKGVHYVPTLAVAQIVLSDWRRKSLPPDSLRKAEELYDGMKDNLRMAYELGVHISYGMDALAQYHLLDLEARAEIVPVVEVIKHATCNAAKTVDMVGKVGCIKEGAFADLLLLDKNPLEDITALSRPDLHQIAVIKDGRCLRSKLEGLKVEISIDG